MSRMHHGVSFHDYGKAFDMIRTHTLARVFITSMAQFFISFSLAMCCFLYLLLFLVLVFPYQLLFSTSP